MSNRAIEFMKLLTQLLGEEEGEANESKKDKKESPTYNRDSRGKNQPVGDYPDSPLRFGGRGKYS